MVKIEARERESSSEIEAKYGPDYFQGKTSEYPSSGYQTSHPDWGPWLDFLGLIQPSGVLIDLGCAFGYLVAGARRCGYQSFGIDISSYALTQEPSLQPHLVRAQLQDLPLPARCADIVSLFDVLEHLSDPLQCLAESVRILKPGGVLIGATPDPLFFPAKEESHCFERPPSFWLEALRRLGLEVRFRFSVESYNFQFLASFPDGPTAQKLDIFQHDFFGDERDFVLSEGPVSAVPRFGWGPLSGGRRALEKEPGSVYLLNQGPLPLRLQIGFQLRHSPDFSLLRVRLDSYVVKEIYLSSELLEHEIDLPELLLPEGGHHLFFDLIPGGPTIEFFNLRISAEPAPRAELIAGLPFDLYQRYRLAADIAGCLRPLTLLDVGGHLGDEGGHLAMTQDFLADSMDTREKGSDAPGIWLTDLRQCDHPAFRPAPAWDQPFPDTFFDLVLSLDTLEHLPEDRRQKFLAELDRLARRWILLGAPFASPQIEEAERDLSQGLMTSQRFLREHRELGLPEASLVEDFFGKRKGYSIYSFPNGYLPRWKETQILSQYCFRLRDYQIIQTFNRLYNRTFYPLDQAEPAYRTVFLICKTPPTAADESALESVRTAEPAKTRFLSDQPVFLELYERMGQLLEEWERAFSDTQFLINERQILIRKNQELIQSLQKELEKPWWRLAVDRLRKRLP